MFTTLIVQPIFNLLIFIYAIIPGHNFGLAVILFTVIIRLMMWPLVKKQLHHAKAMRELQPELKKIKKAAAGDRKKESALVMELYKEREVNPFASLGVILVQLPIFIGLYSGLRKIIDDPQQILNLSYSFIDHLGWLQTLAADIHHFDDSLLGVINLTRLAVEPHGIYWPAMLLVLISATAQFFQTRMLMPKTGDARSLRHILSEASRGKSADQQEVNTAVGQSIQYLIPLLVFIVSIRLAAALSLYWLTSSLVAFIQQRKVLKRDEGEAEALADLADGDQPAKQTPSQLKPSKNERTGASRTGSKKRKRKRRK